MIPAKTIRLKYTILPKIKPMAVGIVYRPSFQTNFLETINEHFCKRDTINKDTYILGDFNINLYLINNMFLRNAPLQFRILSDTMYGSTRNFLIFFSLRQLIS